MECIFAIESRFGMLVSSNTNGVEGPNKKPLLQWPVFTRNSVAGFARAMTLSGSWNPVDFP
jgi:hypothetical protein